MVVKHNISSASRATWNFTSSLPHFCDPDPKIAIISSFYWKTWKQLFWGNNYVKLAIQE